jgi:hypothetical protein
VIAGSLEALLDEDLENSRIDGAMRTAKTSAEGEEPGRGGILIEFFRTFSSAFCLRSILGV